MQLNRDKIKPDLFGEPAIKCPFWPEVAKNIVLMLDRAQPFGYDSTSDFQQKLIVEYWRFFDGLDSALRPKQNIGQWVIFRQWFIQSATAPEKIRRASQWLVQEGYIILRPSIREKALTNAEKSRWAISRFNGERG